MASPVWQSRTTLAGADAANAVIAFPASLAAGDVVLVCLYKENTAAVTPHGTFTQKGTAVSTTAVQSHTVFWYRCVGGETGNMTFSWTGSVWRAATADRITGCVGTGDPIELVNTNFSNSSVTSVNVSLTGTSADSLLIWTGTSFTGGNTWSGLTGFSNLEQLEVISAAQKSNAAGGSTGTVTGVSNISGPSTAILLSLVSGGAAAPADAGLWVPQRQGIILPQNPLYFPFQTPLGVPAPAVQTDATVTPNSVNAVASIPGPAVTVRKYITSIAGSGNQQYPADQNGDPILVKGDVIWGFPGNAGRWGGTYQSVMDDYLDTRQAQGFNLLMIGCLGSTENGTTNDNGETYDGVLPWSTTPGTLNNTYWTRIDYLVDAAAARGITVLLNIAYGYDVSSGALSTATSGQFTTYGTNLGNRYKTRPNVIWGVGGDYFDVYLTEYGNALTAIAATGDTHIQSVQNYPETTSRFDIFNNSSLTTGATYSDWNFVYSYNVTYDGIEYAYDESSPIMAIWGDGHFYQGTTDDRKVYRDDTWWALSSGARGQIFGSEGSWNWQSGAASNISTEVVPDTDLGIFWGIFENLTGWHQLVPDTDSSFVTAGRGTHKAAITSGGGGNEYESTDTQDGYVTASITPDGSLAVVYFPVDQTITVDDAELAAGYTATWVDPTNGATSAATIASTYSPTGSNALSGPDWLLVFEVTGDATVTPAVVAGATSIPAPTVKAGSTATPSTVIAVAAVPAATVRLGVAISPSAVSAIATVPAPTVQAGAGVSPATVSAVGAIPAPSISVGSNATVTPAVVAGVASVPAPTVKAGSTAAPSTVAAVASIPTPTLTGATTVSPATVTAIGSVPGPTVSTGAVVTAATVQAVGSIPAPAVSAGGSAAAAPAVVSAVASVPTPAVATGSRVTASVVTGAASIPAPTVVAGTGATVTATKVSAVATIPTPVVLIGATPAAVVATASIPAPTMHTSGMVSVAPVVGLAAIPAPTVVTLIAQVNGSSDPHVTALAGSAAVTHRNSSTSTVTG